MIIQPSTWKFWLKGNILWCLWNLYLQTRRAADLQGLLKGTRWQNHIEGWSQKILITSTWSSKRFKVINHAKKNIKTSRMQELQRLFCSVDPISWNSTELFEAIRTCWPVPNVEKPLPSLCFRHSRSVRPCHTFFYIIAVHLLVRWTSCCCYLRNQTGLEKTYRNPCFAQWSSWRACGGVSPVGVSAIKFWVSEFALSAWLLYDSTVYCAQKLPRVKFCCVKWSHHGFFPTGYVQGISYDDLLGLVIRTSPPNITMVVHYLYADIRICSK